MTDIQPGDEVFDMGGLPPRKAGQPLSGRAVNVLKARTYAEGIALIEGGYQLSYSQMNLNNLSRGQDLKRLKDIFGDESVETDGLNVIIAEGAVTDDTVKRLERLPHVLDRLGERAAL